jgi:hypothetical protein
MPSAYHTAWLVVFATLPLRMDAARHTMGRALHYKGGFLGVCAMVELRRQEQRALVTLAGVPVGGQLSGTAWLKPDGQSVVVDPRLQHALRRRAVSIEGAGACTDYSRLWVAVRLPMGFGVRRIELKLVTT